MNIPNYLFKLPQLVEIQTVVSKNFEIAAILKKLEPRPAIFEQLFDSQFPVAGNLFCTKEAIAHSLGVNNSQLLTHLSSAIDQHSICPIIERAACQQMIQEKPNLDQLPILRHFPTDGGAYITSGVMIAHHPVFGLNLDFHRAMQISENRLAIRVVRGRHFDTFLNQMGVVEVAICIGVPPAILLAAATSVELGINELDIANALQPVSLTRAKTVDVLVPANAQFVIEGKIYRDQLSPEGPFVDLTETQDIIRHQPVMEVTAITHTENAIWHALLPGGFEHKLLMGMPREPTIFRSVNQVVKCLDVHVNPGGCSWLHVIVQIDKQTEQDGKKAIQATFAGHRSCKHVFVVDKDIDIYNPLEVEWALATRFQGDRDLVILNKETGSSLDPSADEETASTTKIGFDLTIPIDKNRKLFQKVSYTELDLEQYIQSQ